MSPDFGNNNFIKSLQSVFKTQIKKNHEGIFSAFFLIA